ncbi:glutathione S-transferase T2-like [Apium graveolens]|uniref:glutathione S-transferase T2-like n=1 Tax=Apium graveolens TaxID=4045 RepID=UPI003D7B27FC
MEIKKRWQRINEGAQKFGAAYDETRRTAGIGTNMDNLIEKARDYHLNNFKRKFNFEIHWREFRRHPKWRPPPTSASSKRRTKATRRKCKGNATTTEVTEYESIQVADKRRMDIMESLNEIRLKELAVKQSEMDLQVITADTTKMNDAQRMAHAKLLEKIMARN